nr:MAG TPA: hypothetical protein [Caudoviricetes sp.]
MLICDITGISYDVSKIRKKAECCFFIRSELKRARALVIVPSPALFSALLIYFLLILSPY